MDSIISILKNTEPFCRIDFGKTDDDFIKKHCKTVKLKTNENFELKNALALIVSGKARINKCHTKDDKAYLKTVTPMSVIGYATLYDSQNQYISTITAKTAIEMILIDTCFLNKAINTSSDFSTALICILCNKIRYLNKRIDFYTQNNAEKKVTDYLKSLVPDENGKKISNISLTKLSETLNIGRASLYRSLSALEEKGIITKNGKSIMMINEVIL